MAAIAEVLNRSDVFAPRSRYELAGLLTTQKTDIIGQGERHSAAEQRRFRFQLFIDGRPLEFSYSSYDTVLPSWIPHVFQSLSERWGDRHGWDGYDARPTSPDSVVTILNILSDVMNNDSIAPQITPLADGGVQAEWHLAGHDLEVAVSADDPPTYYHFNSEANTEDESEVGPAINHIRTLIGSLS